MPSNAASKSRNTSTLDNKLSAALAQVQIIPKSFCSATRPQVPVDRWRLETLLRVLAMGELFDLDSLESEDGGVQISDSADFKVNHDFAKRFTHNKKREELRRLEDKLGRTSRKRKRNSEEEVGVSSFAEESSSESEDEDDAGELVTATLDSEIHATLNAIRSKDPRVYDQKTTFYSQFNDHEAERTQEKGRKPMYLRDYHRENLLNGRNATEENEDKVHWTYNEEQEELKRSVVGEIHAAAAKGRANGASDKDDDASDDGFLVTKKRNNGPKVSLNALDIEHADRDPENFLSNFMASRAWIPSDQSRFQPFESDESDEDRRAETFEEAYNFRFEDPARANEKLTSHARDVASKHSVRREEENVRRKRRDAERSKAAAAKVELAEEKTRLRKLKIEDVQDKLRKIKRAAGLSGKYLQEEAWSTFLDDTWDDAKWEEEMHKHFGEEYYMDEDVDVNSEEEKKETKIATKKPKVRKPKWDDDIDIDDIVPNLDTHEVQKFASSQDEASQHDLDMSQSKINSDVGETSKGYKSVRQNRKKEVLRERRIIEQLVDERLEIDTALFGESSKKAGFRYRDTSPVSYGLSARDILLAPDSKLNEFVSLKKLAAFRDPEKKKKDQKHLGKRARLRKWRQDTFGNEGVRNANLEHLPHLDRAAEQNKKESDGPIDVRGETGSKKRRRKSKKT